MKRSELKEIKDKVDAIGADGNIWKMSAEMFLRGIEAGMNDITPESATEVVNTILTGGKKRI